MVLWQRNPKEEVYREFQRTIGVGVGLQDIGLVRQGVVLGVVAAREQQPRAVSILRVKSR